MEVLIIGASTLLVIVMVDLFSTSYKYKDRRPVAITGQVLEMVISLITLVILT